VLFVKSWKSMYPQQDEITKLLKCYHLAIAIHHQNEQVETETMRSHGSFDNLERVVTLIGLLLSTLNKAYTSAIFFDDDLADIQRLNADTNAEDHPKILSLLQSLWVRFDENLRMTLLSTPLSMCTTCLKNLHRPE
jgi:hypothetical protein